MIDFTADLDIFFNDSDFAQSATLTTGGATVTTPTVVFFRDVYAVDPHTGQVDIDHDQPSVIGKTADFTAAKHKDTLVINSTTYYVNRILPDGTGVSNIWLYE